MRTLAQDWTELGSRVRAFIGKRVNDSHAADDIVQDVMLKVQTQLESLPPEEKLAAWVLTIARHAIIDHYRSRGVRAHGDIADVDAADDSDEDRRDTAAGLTACVARMITQLPEPYRQAMELADIEGLPQKEIADRIGVSLSGAKSRVQRARQQLRRMLLDCCQIDRDRRGNIVDYQTTPRSGEYCGDGSGKPQCDT